VNRIVALIACVSIATIATQAQAIDLGFGLFKRKPKPETPSTTDAANRLKQLLMTVQTDANTSHRQTAVQELRNYDPRTAPEALAQLIVTMQKDPSSAVRAAAADSIGAIKLIYASAGTALEYAEKNDASAEVRAAAKASLWQYNLNGYRSASGTVNDSSPSQTVEPPLSTQRNQPLPTTSKGSRTAEDVTFRPISQGIGKNAFYQQTTEPPIAKLKAPDAPPVRVKEPAPVVPLEEPMKLPAPVVPLDGPVVTPAPVVPLVETPPTIAPGIPSIPGIPAPMSPLLPSIPSIPSGPSIPK